MTQLIKYPRAWALRISPQLILWLLLSSSIVALSAALSAQYIFAMAPCRLCYLQRIPYFMLMALSLLGLMSPYKGVALSGSLIILILGFLLAVYHCSVQLGWASDPCPSPANIQSADAFAALLSSSVPCSQKSWTLFSLPIAFWNALFLFGMSYGIICINYGARKLSKDQS